MLSQIQNENEFFRDGCTKIKGSKIKGAKIKEN